MHDWHISQILAIENVYTCTYLQSKDFFPHSISLIQLQYMFILKAIEGQDSAVVKRLALHVNVMSSNPCRAGTSLLSQPLLSKSDIKQLNPHNVLKLKALHYSLASLAYNLLQFTMLFLIDTFEQIYMYCFVFC